MTSTTRQVRNIRGRSTQFLDVGINAGTMLRYLGTAAAGGYDDVERVYLVGPRPEHGWLTWALEDIPSDWKPGKHYLEGQHPVLRYEWTGAMTGRKRDVAFHHAESFFPGGGYDARQAAEAYRTLAACVAGAFDGATLLDTPATTGRELMLRSIPKDVEWPVLSEEHRELIRATSGQARIETLLPGDAIDREAMGTTDQHLAHSGAVGVGHLPVLDALYEYDMRLAYAASAWELGAGNPVHDHYAEYMGQQRGRYLVDVTVPIDWDKPFGLLGVKDGNEGWRYPHEPLEQFSTWCDGSELHVLYKHGWGSHLIIRERLLFPKYDHPGPLDLWRDRLVRIYNALRVTSGSVQVAMAEKHRNDLVRAGVRSIILHSIGALHASSHTVTRFSRSIDDVPQWVRSKVRFEGDYCLWPETAVAKWEAMQHPEWSAAIWGRTRARLLDAPKKQGALNICGRVVAFSTDALYLSERQDWTDDRQPGRFRLKRWGDHAMPWPTNRNDVIRLRNALPHVEVEA